MSPSYPNLLSPIDIGPFRIRNRALITAHVPGLERDGLASAAYIAYQRARARGGAGLQISGAATIHRTGAVGAGRGLDNTRPGAAEAYKRLAEAVHDEGGRFLIQLGHAAATVSDSDVGRPLWAPSAVASELNRETPRAMRQADIDEIVAAYAAAAETVVAGGLDGVEILSAFGQLPAAFLSPLTNKRDDGYGGSRENRMRFLREVIAAVRGAVGRGVIVGLRLPGDERVEGGLDQSAMIGIAQALAADGAVDYLNVAVGTNYDRIQRMEHWPPTPAPAGLFAPLAAAIKVAVSLPVFTVGRIVDPAMAERLLADGAADMIGMTRAHIADPDLISKAGAGRAEDIRPCVGASVCIARAMEGKIIRCFHNPEAARETEWGPAQPAIPPRHIAVIGGGPAGMEAARVAAGRGHRVTLFERADRLGGQLAIWAQAPMTAEFGEALAWWERQLEKAQVEIRLGVEATAQAVADLGVDAVILAAGATPARAPLPGEAESAIRVMDPWRTISERPAARRVVIVDEGGGRAALSAADALIEAGAWLELVTTENAVAELVTPSIRAPIYKRLLSAGATFRPRCRLVRLDGAAAVIRDIYSDCEERIEGVDLLVDWRGARASDALEAALAAAGLTVESVGDCVAPRQLDVAAGEGAMAARRI